MEDREANVIWVKQGSYVYGPFDTERDAHIACKALSIHADWMDWAVVNDEDQ